MTSPSVEQSGGMPMAKISALFNNLLIAG